MIKLTQLETQVLNSLIDNLYAESGFSDVDATDIANDIEVDIKSVRGALGSLVKKGIVDIESTNTYGAKEQYEIIYLHSNHYYLHPEWKNEREWSENEILINLDANYQNK
jgi:predicted transcriptional regulator